MTGRGQKKHAGLTDFDVAYAAAAWASGQTQKELGRIFGYTNGAAISTAIGVFIEKYTGTRVSTVGMPYATGADQICGKDRMVFVPKAIANFKASIGA